MREISNLIWSIDGKLPEDKNNLNLLFPIFGQFVDHDITLSVSGRDEPAPVKVPMCDEHFDPECKGKA